MTHAIKTVGFIGTGLMGLPMAKNILAKKFKLNVWNRTSGKTIELNKK
jgi:2-hydroxy-3-oxopropionate reductase